LASPEFAVKADELSKTYRNGVIANDRLNVTVHRGQVYGLLGPNGAGKSTFVQQVMGLIRPTAGNVWVFGVDAERDPERVKRMIGYLPQTSFAMRDLLAEEAIYFTGRLKGLSHRDTLRQRDDFIEQFDADEIRRKPVSQLSGGMQRMTGFIMALLGQPPLLVLDEPTNDLDPLRRRAVWEAIRRAVIYDGSACLLVTHNVLEAERVVDRVALIDEGRVLDEGTPGAMKSRLGNTIRLELWLRDGSELSRAQELQLEALGTLHQPRPRHLLLRVPQDNAGAAIDRVLAEIGADAVEDFRLATASLEDVYVEIMGRSLEDDDGSAMTFEVDEERIGAQRP
jgi:ABC-type multidrug transport system ATPase subunit